MSFSVSPRQTLVRLIPSGPVHVERAKVGAQKHPYRRLQAALAAIGRPYSADDRFTMMQEEVGLAGFALSSGDAPPIAMGSSRL